MKNQGAPCVHDTGHWHHTGASWVETLILSRASSSAQVLTKFAIELVVQSRYHQSMNGVINKVNNGRQRTMKNKQGEQWRRRGHNVVVTGVHMDFTKSTTLHHFQLHCHWWLNVECSTLNTNCILTLPSFACHCQLSKPFCMSPELHSSYDSFPKHLGTMIFIQPSQMILLSSEKNWLPNITLG